MTVSRCLAMGLVLGMAASATQAQALFAPRAAAFPPYGTAVKDSRGFTANPAGLTGMRDWDFNAASSRAAKKFVFAGFGLGKRFLDHHAIAFQYTPGTVFELIQPASLTVVGVNIPADRKISYAEPFAAAYAMKPLEELTLGLQARMRTETVNDPQYQFEIKDTAIVPVPKEFSSTVWFADIGAIWRPTNGLTLSAIGRGIVRFTRGELPEEFASYTLPRERSLEVAVAYAVAPAVTLGLGASTTASESFGVEWLPGWNVALRGGLYGSAETAPFVHAYGVGAGWSYGFIEIDASYLRFARQENRKGTVSVAAFDASSIRDIGMTPYTADRASFSVRAVLGSVKESLARIEGVEMLGGIYPSAYESLAFRPIGRVKVRNISKTPIQARASFSIDRYMDQPTETQPVYIAPGEQVEIPLMAVFNDLMRTVARMTIREGTVTVSATVAEDFDDKAQTRVLIHGKNDWDGNVFSLRYFVTPDDPDIIRYSRDVLLQHRDSLAAGPSELASFRNARSLFNTFAGRLSYVADPKQSADYVQYPAETLKLRGGDCDDMTVCFASLLSSVGISTAFVDVVPPGRPDASHVYLLFDTGIDPKFGTSIADNPKRYIVRRGKSDAGTIWIPIESTVITRGFEEAWTAGAQKYFDDVEVGLGLIKGWVRIVDVN